MLWPVVMGIVFLLFLANLAYPDLPPSLHHCIYQLHHFMLLLDLKLWLLYLSFLAQSNYIQVECTIDSIHSIKVMEEICVKWWACGTNSKVPEKEIRAEKDAFI